MDLKKTIKLLIAERKGLRVKRLLRAANKGNAKAQLRLGIMRYEGSGRAKDIKASTRWFHRAATNGSSRAQIYLARNRFEGDGAYRDIESAYAWIDQAVVKKRRHAKKWQMRIILDMTQEELKEAKILSRELGKRLRSSGYHKVKRRKKGKRTSGSTH